jgi:hypothetical protein
MENYCNFYNFGKNTNGFTFIIWLSVFFASFAMRSVPNFNFIVFFIFLTSEQKFYEIKYLCLPHFKNKTTVQLNQLKLCFSLASPFPKLFYTYSIHERFCGEEKGKLKP